MADETILVSDGYQAQQEAVGMGAAYDPTGDSGIGAESITPTVTIIVSQAGAGTDQVVITATATTITDSGTGIDAVFPGKAYFLITHDGRLLPLGVKVLNDSRQDLLPEIIENTEEIPGRHGRIDFGSKFGTRGLELTCIFPREYGPNEREQSKRTLAGWLGLGVKDLIFADDYERTYKVKLTGRLGLDRAFGSIGQFTLAFKCDDPFIYATFEQSKVGGGTINNQGNFETPLIIEVQGIVVDPSVTINGVTLAYAGSLGAGDNLIINTGTLTVTFNGVNALANYSGGFPKLQPGSNTVVAAAGGTTIFKWRPRWI